jgi:hypothetical protein
MKIVNDNRFTRTSVDNQLFSHRQEPETSERALRKKIQIGDPDPASENN